MAGHKKRWPAPLVEGGLGYELRVRDPLYEPAVRELFAIGNNLNQLAKHANTTGQIDPQELADALRLWREVVIRLHE